MNKRIELKRLLFTAFISCTLFMNAQITVDNKTDTNALYSDLQTAINAANSGDTIYVHSSITNYGSIEIDRKIVLVGRTPRTKPATISQIEVKLSGSGTIIKGLNISNISTTFATDLLIQNNKISNIDFGDPTTTNKIATIRGNVINTIANPKNTLITNNYITDIYSIQEINSTVITQNIFYTNANITNTDSENGKKALIQNSMFLVNSTSPLTLRLDNINLTNCLLFNYGGATYEVENTNQNFSSTDILENTNPQFTKYNSDDTADITNDYTLKTGSPAIAAGLNSQDIGIMGNGYSFRPTLQPYGFPTIEILTSTAHVPENGTLKVTFSGKSN
jgi:hypothetical protein